jgi:hypothetical protein
MRLVFLVCFFLLPAAALALPVKIVLQANSCVQADSSGFFSMGSVATLTGGSPGLRADLAAIPVGRAPLPGDVRELTPGDLILKLRQAGYEPGTDADVSGVAQASVTLAAAAGAPAATIGTNGTPSSSAAPPASPIVVHPGDPVTIRVEEDGIKITASGTAQSAGAVGDTVRVYRPGCPTALVATVLDAQDVLMEP